jgi:hypothetical protein
MIKQFDEDIKQAIQQSMQDQMGRNISTNEVLNPHDRKRAGNK